MSPFGIQFIAHRGYAFRYPENTLASIRAAVKAGAKYVEVDVQLSSDGRAVIMHDAALKRMCGKKGKVWNYKYQDLLKMNAGEQGRLGKKFSKVKVAGLKDLARFLRRHPGVFAFIEAKIESIRRFGISRMLQAILEGLGPAARQCALISFSYPFLAYARQHCRLPLGWVLTGWWHAKGPHAGKLKPEYLFVDRFLLPAIGSLKVMSSKLCVYEVRDADLVLKLVRRGVDFIETMQIKEMIGKGSRLLPEKVRFRGIKTALPRIYRTFTK